MARTYVALDLETTGLDSRRDAIIEVGALRFKGDRVLDEFQYLVNPGRPIPYLVQNLTGISNDDVRDASPFGAIRSNLLRFVGNSPIIGHNIQFDLAFLKNHGLFEQNPSIDTFELASILLPHAERYSLQSLAMLLNVEEPPTHRALDDARVTHRLFERLLDQARRLDSQIIDNVAKMAAKSQWSLAPVFQDLSRERSSQFAASPFGQLLSDSVQELLEDHAPPLDPIFPPRRLDVAQLARQIEPGGLIDKAFPHFEHRPQQVAMLKAVADAFNEAYHLMVEAGTGTGKSMAYLLPAIHWATTNNQRVVISTNTINLQDQILNKDIPDLTRTLKLNLKATALKGRGNYVCPWRVEQMRRKANLSTTEMRLLAKIMVWMPNTTTGDKQELFIPNYAEQALWHQVNANAETCPPDRCAREGCFFARARQAAESAHIIVVNHALLLADIAVNNRVIPEYTYLVIDEAHHLENSITNQLGFSINKSSLAQLLTDLTSRKNSLFAQIAHRIKAAGLDTLQADAANMAEAGYRRAEEAEKAWYDLFNTLDGFIMEYSPQARTQYDRRLRLSANLRTQPAWSDVEISWDNAATTLSGLQKLMKQVGRLWDGLDSFDVDKWEDTMLAITDFRSRLDEVGQHMNLIFSGDDDNLITWLEQKSQTQDISAHAAPLHVGNLVREHLLEAKESVVFTSATMRTDNSFEYIKERLSAWDVSELAVGSPFDYAASTMVYVPTDIPEPAQNGFQKAFEAGLRDLLLATQGRTLALFTSYNHLRTTARALRKPLADHNIVLYQQGSGASRRQLLDNFKKADKAVLLGTRSFWEGIDVPGPALSCVVIAKIPFAVPSDPIVQARSETFDDAFSQYSIPEAILHFRQGFGRLIRARTDRGVVVIMDKRTLSKGYGRAFLDSLPDATIERGSISDLPHLAADWIDAE